MTTHLFALMASLLLLITRSAMAWPSNCRGRLRNRNPRCRLENVYTFSNATSFVPEGSPFISFMFELPMYQTYNPDSPELLSTEIGTEAGNCQANLNTGLIVCANIVQIFQDGQLMLQGTGNFATDCTLHAVVGGTGAYTGIYGSAKECDQGNDVVAFEYDVGYSW